MLRRLLINKASALYCGIDFLLYYCIINFKNHFIMKKLLLCAAFAVCAFSTVHSQQMKAGVDVMLPMGDFKDGYSLGVGANFTYFFEISDSFLVGPQASLLYYMGKEVEEFGVKYTPDDAMYLPIAASARYVMDDFFVGVDLGYGIGLAPDNNDGGLFYRPKAGYSFGSVSAVLSYLGVSTKQTVDTGFGTASVTSTFSSLNLGVEFSF